MNVVLLGNGNPDFIEDFSRRNNLDDKQATILTDPSLVVYQYAGLLRSKRSTFGASSVIGLAKALAKGHAQGAKEGDATQQGGLIVLDGEGAVRYLYRNQHIADHADTNAVMAVALSIAARDAKPPQGGV